MLSDINTLEVNIMTLEEPVEYRLSLVRQTHVREILSFSEGVKSILRQDPDVILIGEVRDEATAQMALRASMTGHRVFTTLHTQDVLGVIYRLEDLGIKSWHLVGNLTAIIAQRLVRRLCDSCKRAEDITPETSKLLQCDESQSIFTPVGCKHCHHTGFRGRMAVAEVVNFNPHLDDLMMSRRSRSEILRSLHQGGHKFLVQEARGHVIGGQTNLCEIDRCIDLRGGQ